MAMSEPKKRRKEAVESYDRRHLVSALLGLCGNVGLYKTQITLTPLKIKNCNATASSGASFSKAFCDTEPYNEGIVFGDVFQTGIKILRNFAITKKLPEERQMCLALKKLIDFINGGMYVHVSVAVPDHTSSPEPLGQFQPNLAQIIFGWRGFKFVQMKGHALFQGEIITK